MASSHLMSDIMIFTRNELYNMFSSYKPSAKNRLFMILSAIRPQDHGVVKIYILGSYYYFLIIGQYSVVTIPVVKSRWSQGQWS